MAVVCFGLWWVAIYGLRVAVFGNPVYTLLTETSPELIAAIENGGGRSEEPAEEEAAFQQHFGRSTSLQAAVLILELGLLLYLWSSETAEILCMALLSKNLLCAALAVGLASKQSPEETGPYKAILGLPAWVSQLDRVSSFISGAGALVLLVLYLSKANVW